jgi:hypothetical protein
LIGGTPVLPNKAAPKACVLAAFINQDSQELEWLPVSFRMSQYRIDGSLWHLVQSDLMGSYWLPDREMRCPHTELKRWLRGATIRG